MVTGKNNKIKRGKEAAFPCNHLLEGLGGSGIMPSLLMAPPFFHLDLLPSTSFAFLGLPDSLIVIFEISNTMKSFHSEIPWFVFQCKFKEIGIAVLFQIEVATLPPLLKKKIEGGKHILIQYFSRDCF